MPKVGIARLPSCSYPSLEDRRKDQAEKRHAENSVSQALRRLADTMDWSDERGPFGKVIPRGARVLIKPNLVLHQNEGPGGLDCLVTHSSLIRAAVEAALQTDAAELLVGDAPIQACNFDALMESSGLRKAGCRHQWLSIRDSKVSATFAARSAAPVLLLACASQPRTCNRKIALRYSITSAAKACWSRSAPPGTAFGWLGQ